jgi:hypothetical protein
VCLHFAAHFSAPQIVSSAVDGFHGVPDIRFTPIQVFSKGFATASKHLGLLPHAAVSEINFLGIVFHVNL